MRFSFGNTQVSTKTFEVLRAGERIVLSRRAFDVLLHLIENRDHVVTRSELMKACWSDVVVSDGALNTCIKELRRQLGDPPRAGEIIRTVHGRGYQFVATVREEDSPSLPASGPSSHGWSLLPGHAAACEAVDAIVDGGVVGQGTLLRVVGEPGAGKTHLAEYAAGRARALGLQVLRADGSDLDGAPSFWLWTQLLRAAAEQIPSAQWETIAGSYARTLAAVVPELAGRLPALEPEPTLTAAEKQFRTINDLVRVLNLVAQRQPLLLVLDDLQWVDVSSLRTLEQWARSLPSSASALLLHRPVSAGHALQATYGTLARAGHREELILGPLCLDDVRTLVRQTVQSIQQRALEEKDVERIVSLAEGNPLYVVELTRQHVADLEGMPETLLSVVQRRIEDMDPALVLVVQTASVLGRVVETRLLASTCEVPPERVAAALAQAEARYLIKRDAAMPGQIAFAHAATRDLVYALTPEATRRTVHRRAADQLEKVLGPRPDVLRALHYHVDECEDSRKAVSLALAEMEHACAMGAHEAASAVAQVALDPRCDITDGLDRVRLVLEQARALASAGAGLPEVMRLFASLRNVDTSRLAPELVAEVALEATGFGTLSATSRRQGFCLPEEIRVLEDALGCLSVQSVWRPLVGGWLAHLLQRSSRSSEADALSRQSLAEAYALGEPRVLCGALVGRSAMLSAPEHRRERAVLSAQALMIAKRIGHASLEIEALAQHMATRLSQGKDCRVDAERIEMLAQRAGLQSLARPAVQWRLGRALARVELEEAQALSQQAFEMAHQRNPVSATLDSVFVELVVRQITCDLGHFRRSLQQMLRLDPDNHAVRASTLGVLLACRDLEAASPLLDDLMAALPDVASHVDRLNIYSACARSAATLHRLDDVKRLRQICAPYEDLWLAAGDVLVWVGPASYDLGVLADAMGDFREADRLFDKALASCNRLGARGLSLMVDSQWAASRLGRGEGMDEAVASLRGLREEAEAIGHTAQVRAIDAVIRLREPGMDSSRSVWRSSAAAGRAANRSADSWAGVSGPE